MAARMSIRHARRQRPKERQSALQRRGSVRRYELWVAVAWHDGLTFALPFNLIFVTAIIALIFIDAEHMILPNAIPYPGMLFALIARLALPYLMCRPSFDDL